MKMDEQRSMLADAVGRLFRDAATTQAVVSDGWNAQLAHGVEALGLPLLLVPASAGGFGGCWEDAFVVLQAVGFHAIALPIGETMVAARLLATAGLDVPAGLLGLAAASDGRVVGDAEEPAGSSEPAVTPAGPAQAGSRPGAGVQCLSQQVSLENRKPLGPGFRRDDDVTLGSSSHPDDDATLGSGFHRDDDANEAHASEHDSPATKRGSAVSFTGELFDVPWGADTEQVVAVFDRQDGERWVLCVARAHATSTRIRRNLAGEPRVTLRFENAPAMAAHCACPEAAHLHDYCALLRVAQAAGALEAALIRSVQYAKERVQFGRPIGTFQAMQHQLAVLGSEAAAVACAARAACHAADQGDAPFEIAAAKLRTNLAIDAGAGIAHQVHGAIGFTREYDLRHSTQRLWSWRSEFGNDHYWSERLGTIVAARGAAAFWPDLTAREAAQ